jgi:hypothetical protein
MMLVCPKPSSNGDPLTGEIVPLLLISPACTLPASNPGVPKRNRLTDGVGTEMGVGVGVPLGLGVACIPNGDTAGVGVGLGVGVGVPVGVGVGLPVGLGVGVGLAFGPTTRVFAHPATSKHKNGTRSNGNSRATFFRHMLALRDWPA